jgi:hypothetical protein
MLRSYPIVCTSKGCPRLAVYKIAARWSDGATEELKTYALCCVECLPEAYRLSCQKQKACRTARGETLEAPGIYLLAQGQRDQTLKRCPELETPCKKTE